ncbi:hypothetical protein F0562_034054 [Nyssa sinensis]|uniref:BHLH domain-containing protein n=1 Tax=Nyssa sinensis TaxID=561372 RepID=A0A5J5AI85_9ASTE|nr:hypothetical protein F0562_034054 [Nyssa sinensis]
MAEFTGDLQNLNPSFSDMNSPTMELLKNLSALDNLNSNVQGLVGLSNDSFLDHNQQPPLPMTFNDNIQSSFHPEGPFYNLISHFLPSAGGLSQECKTVKAMPGTDHLMDSSPPISGTSLVGDNKTTRNYNSGGKRRKRNNEREVEKPRDVIHVRAKRGQATDSHSLAERLRRERINEKLRCLQELVPGCYKTMGMAVMLDVIINYLRSLQNQIEFLSMKISAASLVYDFNSLEMDAMEKMQGTNGYEPQVMERMVGEGYGGFSYFP